MSTDRFLNQSGRLSAVALVAAAAIAAGFTGALDSAGDVMAADRGAQLSAGGGSLGPSRGTVGAGASGASNIGGAGGVSNPVPGGMSGPVANSLTGEGAANTENTRPGYLGGRETSAEGGGSTTTVIIDQHADVTTGGTVASQILLGAAGTRCNAVEPWNFTAIDRLSGANLARLEEAGALLAPADSREYAASLRFVLASLQEELGKDAPDVLLASTYLGVSAAVPLTANLVEQLSHSLCTPIGKEEASQIAAIAESQRLRLAGRNETANVSR